MPAMSLPAPDQQPELKRIIGRWSSVALVTGLIIGSGIFASPNVVAKELPSAWLMLLAWILGALLSAAGGLSAAELAVRYPRSGGQYVFLREAFGRAVAFAFGWSYILIARPSVIAAIATVFAIYFVGLFGLPAESQKWWAIAGIAVFTIVNCLGVKEGTRTQNIFTWAKIAGLAVLAGAALLSGRGDTAHFAGAMIPALEHSLPVALALGLITILYTYDGWIDVTFVAGEVKNPQKVLPFAIILGTGITLALYLLANVAYVLLLSPAEMAANENIGAVALERAFGQTGNLLLSTLVMVSTLGILNGVILTGVRVPYAMARDRVLFAGLGRIHPRTESPVNALLAQGIFSILVVVFLESFDRIASLFVAVAWSFYAVTFAGLLWLQWRERGTPRDPEAYRMPLSPWPAVLFIIATVLIVGTDVVHGGLDVIIGLLLVALGIPIYWVWERLRGGSRA
jgi:amino acid transporter